MSNEPVVDMTDEAGEQPEQPLERPQLRVWATVREAYAIWFANYGLWLKLAIVPVVCLVGLSVLGQTVLEIGPESLAADDSPHAPERFFLSVLIYLSQVPLVTAWHRTILEPRAAAGHGYRIGNREGRYLLNLFVIALAIGAIFMVASILAGLLLPAIVGSVSGYFGVAVSLLLSVALYLGLGYLLVGGFLVLPAAAIGREIRLGPAMLATNGNEWRLLGIYAVALLPVWGLAVILELFAAAAATGSLLVENVLYFGPELLFAPAIVGVLSITYRELVQKPEAAAGPAGQSSVAPQ